MKTILTASLVLGLFTACGGEPAKTPTPPAPAGNQPAPPMDEHGERKPLGSLTIGEHTFEVVQFGDVVAGAEVFFDLDFPAGKPLPGTLRGWLGVEAGTGSMKAKFTKETDSRLHGHVLVPDKPEGSKAWFEIEGADGVKRASVAWK